MDKFDRIYALHTLLSQARIPITKATIQQELECSHATAERLIKEMRLYLDAPIEYDRAANGYFYNKQSSARYELPGLWFNASELYALLVTQQLFSEVEPGILNVHIAPLKEKIETLLHTKALPTVELSKRVRILKMASRRPRPKYFGLVASALLTRKRLEIKYLGRERDKYTERVISPQRLIHYRDNWYLDAWCHLREELRSFALERIETSNIRNDSAIDIDKKELDEHYATAYGIFAGKPNHKALLKFSKQVARWVADEKWHPEQKGQFDLDGSYELEIPYRNPQELIMDIMKYGPDVEVLKPEQLRNVLKEKLELTKKLYR